MGFPEDFAWGAATASYQVEGAHDAEGKGPSVWDQMVRWPGRIKGGQRGDVACDHYHRYGEDVALMRRIGLGAYRLSLSWPRILPEGTGSVNEAGLAFYDRLVDALLEAGVRPWVTLFHWDYPLALYHRGGWLNRGSVEWFAEYAQVVVDRLSDRVEHWMTLNEPQVFLGLGHRSGTHAPGLKLPLADVLRAGHHVLLAHGRAVQVIRERAKRQPSVGWAPVGVVRYPGSDSAADVEAARTAMMSVEDGSLWSNTWFSDPAVLGHYPEDGLRLFGADAPQVAAGEMETIQQPLDFYGANIYSGAETVAGEDGQPEIVPRQPGHARTAFNWPVEPKALYWGPRLLQQRYSLPIVITENGFSSTDWVDLDGRVRDPQRIDYTRRYLLALEQAIDDGVAVGGYFHWTLMDNFEWAEGFDQRFGLIHVDVPTGTRTVKDSAWWYQRVIETNGRALHEEAGA